MTGAKEDMNGLAGSEQEASPVDAAGGSTADRADTPAGDRSSRPADLESRTIADLASDQADAGSDGADASKPPSSGGLPLDDLAAVEELARLRQELDGARDRLMRQAAEFQNYRRRTDQEKAQMVAIGKSLVVQQVLDVVDDFERSLDAARTAASASDAAPGTEAFTSLQLGVELVYNKLRDELGKLGVEEIHAIGQPFSEDEHEALMQQPAPEGTEPGMVMGEIQKGYRMGERVLRHAKVIVAA